jgi:hypothetical protein
MSDPKFQLERVRAPVTDEELIADIQRVAELAGTKAVSFRLYSEVGNYHPTTAALLRCGPPRYPAAFGHSMARLCQASVRGVHTNSTLA